MFPKKFLKRAFFCSGLIVALSITSIIIQSCCEETFCLVIQKVSLVAKDNSGSARTDYKDSVKPKALILLMVAEKDMNDCAYLPTFSLITRSYALSCNRNYISDRIVTFNIYADKKFDAAHEAGVRLNDLFKIEDASEVYKDYQDSGTELYLLNNPDDTGTYTFSVHLELESGKVFEASTEPVKLVK